MKNNYKIALIAFSGSLLVLAAFLWMPIYLAGPDGLERVLFNLTGNEDYEPDPGISYDAAPFPDYSFKVGENGYIHSWLIGLIGAAITAAIMFGLLKLITIKKPNIPKIEDSINKEFNQAS